MGAVTTYGPDVKGRREGIRAGRSVVGHLPTDEAREVQVEVALSDGFGLGGHDTALVFGRPGRGGDLRA